MDDMRIGTVIRLARQGRGWRQRDLEQRSGVSQSTISRIEAGQIGPQSIDSLRAVAETAQVGRRNT